MKRCAMREIKFRGIRKDAGEWAVGHYFQSTNMITHCISPKGSTDMFEIDPSTAGQYIGIHDRKRTEEYPEGQPIFEADICRITQACGEEIVGEVVWDADYLRYVLDIGHDLWDFADIIECYHEIEVIGNIHQNPELLDA